MENWVSIAEFPPTPIGIPLRIHQFDATVAKLTILHPLYTILKFPPAHSVLQFTIGFLYLSGLCEPTLLLQSRANL